MEYIPQELASAIVAPFISWLIWYIRSTFKIKGTLNAYYLSLGVSVLGGIFVGVASGLIELTWTKLFTNIGIIFLISQTVYRQYKETSSSSRQDQDI